MSRPNECGYSWGSHACDLPLGHAGAVHRCASVPDDPCCEYDAAAEPRRVRHYVGDDGWGEWLPATPGWPS